MEVWSFFGALEANIKHIKKLQKIIDGTDHKKKLGKLLEELEYTEGVMSQLQKLIEYEGYKDADQDWSKVLYKLRANLGKTEKFVLKQNKLTEKQAGKFGAMRRCKKDATSLRSILKKSRKQVLSHVSIKSLQNLQLQTGIKNPVNIGIQSDSQTSDYQIKKSDLTRRAYYANGQWGPVMTATFKEDQEVLMKTIRDVGNKDVIENFRKEASYLMDLPGSNVVKLIGVLDEDDAKYLVLEYMQKGRLDHLLHECSHETLEPKKRVSMALDAAKAIFYVDVSALPEGIATKIFLVNKDFEVKINGLKFSNIVNSKFYTSPEKYNHQEYNMKNEVYGLGIVLWEILSRSKPFSTHRQEPSFDDVKTFVEGGQMEELTQDFGNPNRNARLNDLVKKCRNRYRSQRPAVQDIVNELENILELMEKEDQEDENKGQSYVSDSSGCRRSDDTDSGV